MLHGCFLQSLQVTAITLMFALLPACSDSDKTAQIEDELRSTLAGPSLQSPTAPSVAVPEALSELQASSPLATPLPANKLSRNNG